jgi:hypothetical protein
MASNLSTEQDAEIYLLCPVRKITPEIRRFLDSYVAVQEARGKKVHYPPRDVNQNDPTGLQILTYHKEAMKKCKEVHAYWVKDSEGSIHDLGMVLMSEKPFMLINRSEVADWLLSNSGKSFTRVAYELDRIYNLDANS